MLVRNKSDFYRVVMICNLVGRYDMKKLCLVEVPDETPGGTLEETPTGGNLNLEQE